jgi:surfeit locus 1 family protein
MRVTRHAALIWLGAAVAVAATVRLGLWQLDRAAQKTALQQERQQREVLPPIPAADLARTMPEAEAQHHRRITLGGRWLGPLLYLDNQPLDGRVGFVAVAPLLLGSGDAVLVRRGWSPRDPADRSRVPPLALPEGPVTLSARIAPWPSRRFELGEADQGLIRQNLDSAMLAREWGVVLRPLSLLEQQQAGQPDDGWIRSWPLPALDIGKHHGYAFQWFALATLITGLTLWYRLIRPRREDRR